MGIGNSRKCIPLFSDCGMSQLLSDGTAETTLPENEMEGKRRCGDCKLCAGAQAPMSSISGGPMGSAAGSNPAHLQSTHPCPNQTRRWVCGRALSLWPAHLNELHVSQDCTSAKLHQTERERTESLQISAAFPDENCLKAAAPCCS